MSALFGAPLLDLQSLGELLARLTLDLLFATALIRLIYYRLHRNREYVFTYYAFNVITFCLCLIMSRVATSFGLALALFGVFGILRYRTEQIRIRDLTYLFIVIGVGVLNAVADKTVSVVELLVVNAIILGMTALLEVRFASAERSTSLLYDQLELLRPGHEDKLIANLAARTGLTVVRVEVERVDLLRDAAELTIFYRADRQT